MNNNHIHLLTSQYTKVNWLNANEAQIQLAPEAEYDFFAYLDFEDDQYFQLSAKLRNAPKGTYFWYTSIIFNSKDNSLKSATEKFIKLCGIVSSHPTRIRQTKGWLWYSFSLDYYENNSWHSTGAGCSCFRFGNFPIPNKFSKRFLYFG